MYVTNLNIKIGFCYTNLPEFSPNQTDRYVCRSGLPVPHDKLIV